MTLVNISDIPNNLVATVSGTAAANNTNLFLEECFLYRSVSFRISGTFVATMEFQLSNDNSTFTSVIVNAISTALSTATSITGAGLFICKTFGFRYCRLRTTALVSGTANVSAVFSSIDVSAI